METRRIEDLCEREPRFAERVFTRSELDYSLARDRKYLHLSGRFAAKEAVAKALGRSFGWKDVEVVNNADGKPEVNLRGKAKAAIGDARVHLSLSHTKHYACAVAVVEERA